MQPFWHAHNCTIHLSFQLIAGLESLDKPVTDSILNEIAATHCDAWRSLPPYLDLPISVLSDIEQNHDSDEKKKMEFFKLWKERKGSEATYRKLIGALFALKTKCVEDAESICRLLFRTFSPIIKGN